MVTAALGVTAIAVATLSVEVAEAAPVNRVVTVDRVVDGDTFEYRSGGSTVRVRVAGLNANELAQSPKCQVDEATNRLRTLIEGRSVRLLADDSSSTAGGREYRHVFLGSQNVAETMLREGLAVPLILRDEPDHAIDLLAAAEYAESRGVGVWDQNGCGNGGSANVEFIANGDADGDDRVNVNGEYVRIRNRASSTLSLNGWSLTDTSLETYDFPNGTSIAPGGLLTVHVGNGSDTASRLFMGRSGPIFNDSFDGAFLLDPQNNIRAHDIWPCAGRCEGIPERLVIDSVSYDPPGNDDEDPNREFIVVRNAGDTTVDLRDWEISSWPHEIRPETSLFLSPNEAATIFVGQGTASGNSLFMGKTSSILNTEGDVVLLVDPGGDIADCFSYGSGSCAAHPPNTLVRDGFVDINGDGRGDVVVAAPGENNSSGAIGVSITSGPALGLDGPPNHIATASSNGLVSQTGPVPGVSEAGDSFGSSIAVGDFNSDGFSDVAVGNPGENSSAGSVVVIPGAGWGLDVERSTSHSQSGPIDGSPEAGDRFGETLAVGDFDGDGYDDLAIGVPGENSSSGIITVLPGSATGLRQTDLTMSQTGPIPGASEAGDSFGGSLTVGDFNGDGRDDLAVGLPGEDIGTRVDAGAVVVIDGSGSGLREDRSEAWDQSDVAPGTPEAGDEFGAALAAGDLDGDGDVDLAIGAPGEAIGSVADAGYVLVIRSTGSSGLGSGNAFGFRQGLPLSGSPETGDRVGASLVALDLDAIGPAGDELVIGVPGEDFGSSQRDTGMVHVLERLSETTVVHQGGPIPGSNERGDRFGATLGVARIDLDPHSDLVIGVPGETLSGASDAGGVVILPGRNSGVPVDPARSIGWIQSRFGGATEAGDRWGGAVSS